MRRGVASPSYKKRPRGHPQGPCCVHDVTRRGAKSYSRRRRGRRGVLGEYRRTARVCPRQTASGLGLDSTTRTCVTDTACTIACSQTPGCGTVSLKETLVCGGISDRLALIGTIKKSPGATTRPDNRRGGAQVDGGGLLVADLGEWTVLVWLHGSSSFKSETSLSRRTSFGGTAEGLPLPGAALAVLDCTRLVLLWIRA